MYFAIFMDHFDALRMILVGVSWVDLAGGHVVIGDGYYHS